MWKIQPKQKNSCQELWQFKIIHVKGALEIACFYLFFFQIWKVNLI